MKNLLLAVSLLMLVAPIQARDLATAENQAGGTIVVSSLTCPGMEEGEAHIIYNRDSVGRTQFGCWVLLDEDRIVAFWNDGEVYTYDIDSFTPVEQSDTADKSRKSRKQMM